MRDLLPVAGILVAVVAILLPALIIFIVFYYKHRREEALFATVRHLADKGLPVPRELLDPPDEAAKRARVRQQLRRLTRGDNDLADDLAQDCFVQARRELARFRGDALFSTWLHRIAYRRFLMHQRAMRATHATLPSAHGEEFAAANESPSAGPRDPLHAAPHEAGTLQAMQLDVERAVARLPEAERIAIIHCYQLDLAHDEAAAVLGIPLGTLKTQVARAKERLRDWLLDWQQEIAT